MANKSVKTDLNIDGDITANSFVKNGGTSSEFLKADGSVDDTTYTKSIWIENPTATDDIGLWSTDVDITLIKAETYIVGGTSVTFNISHNTNPTTITDLWTADKVANTTTTVQSHSGSVNDDTVAAGEVIRYMASGAVGSPTGIKITIFYTID